MVVYKGNEKNKQLYSSLPPSVLSFLGKPLSSKALLELAKTDSLDLIYTSQKPADASPMITRSKSTKQELQDTLSLAEALHEDEAEDDLPPIMTPQKPSHNFLPEVQSPEYAANNLEPIMEEDERLHESNLQ